ncbi:MAG: GGDEF domain-containing protein [Ruminococcaceae bacterium]|nr:GGDEF domain-containing protein [Oscillospiraceae bacterium]
MSGLYEQSYDILPTGVITLLLDQGVTVENANPWFAERSGASVGDSLISLVDESQRESFELWLHKCAASVGGRCEDSAAVKIGNAFFVFRAAKFDFSGNCIKMLCVAESADRYASISMREKRARHRGDAISEIVGKVIFMFDLESNEIRTLGGFSARIGGLVAAEKYPSVLCGLGLITAQGAEELTSFLFESDWEEPDELKLDVRFDFSNLVPAVIIPRALRDELGNISEIVCVVTPVNEEDRSAALADQIGHLDALTGVPSKDYFEEIVIGSLATCPDDRHALIMLELDGCKKLNESRGHMFGDMVLKELCGVINSKLGEQDTLGRYAGAVFCVFCRSIVSERYVTELADSIKNTIDDNYTVRRAGFEVRCNYGIAIYRKDGDSSAELLRRADIAMYKSKSDRNRPIKFI